MQIGEFSLSLCVFFFFSSKNKEPEKLELVGGCGVVEIVVGRRMVVLFIT